MEEAKRKRAAAKGWLRRESEKLTNLLVDFPVDSTRLQDCVSQFELRLNNFDQSQEAIESQTDLENLEQNIAESAEFRDKQREPFIRAQQYLSKPSDRPVDDEISIHSLEGSIPANSTPARLLKLELPKFYGEVTTWINFWDQFNAVVHNTPLPVITKFTYLQSLLKGEAASAIKGLATTAENYETARNILEKRFGRKERIIFGHIQQLLTTKPPRQGKGDSLWGLHDELQAHVLSLETLGVDGDKYGVILTPLLLHRIPLDFRLEWARVGEGREGDLNFLLSFLYEEICRRERSRTFNSTTSTPLTEERSKKPGSASALFMGSGNDKGYYRKNCIFCKAEHFSDQCSLIQNLNADSWKERLKELGLCFICLRASHVAKICKSKCGVCGGRHHRVLCYRNQKHLKSNELETRTSVKQTVEGDGNSQRANLGNNFVKRSEDKNPNTVNQDGQCSHMGIAYANSQFKSTTTVVQTVYSQIGNCKVAILFDSGSDRSFITKKIARELDLELVGRESISFSRFGNSKPTQQVPRNMWKFSLGKGGPNLLLTEIQTISAPMYRTEIPQEHMLMFNDLDFKEDYSRGRHVEIDILIGIDYYWQLMKPNIIKSSSGLVAQDTVFGWMLSGTWPSNEGNGSLPSHQFLCMNDVSECMIRRFWDLESIGITDGTKPDDKVLDSFNKSVKFEEGRYEVELPWKHDKREQLMNNEPYAKARLHSLTKRLKKQPELETSYNKVLTELEIMGIIHEVPEEEIEGFVNPVFYLSHRPVIRVSSVTTKIRPVFDASAKGVNDVSLNDCLQSGPNLIPNLLEILLRFRRWRFGLTADIS